MGAWVRGQLASACCRATCVRASSPGAAARQAGGAPRPRAAGASSGRHRRHTPKRGGCPAPTRTRELPPPMAPGGKMSSRPAPRRRSRPCSVLQPHRSRGRGGGQAVGWGLSRPGGEVGRAARGCGERAGQKRQRWHMRACSACGHSMYGIPEAGHGGSSARQRSWHCNVAVQAAVHPGSARPGGSPAVICVGVATALRGVQRNKNKYELSIAN